MVKRTNDPRQLELVLPFPEPVAISVPAPSFPEPGLPVSSRDTVGTILVLGLDDVVLGNVDPVQAPVLSRVLDRITRDTIAAELGKPDESGFEVVLHRRIDGNTKRTNFVRCTWIEPYRQAA